MKNVYIIASYSTRFKRWPETSFKDLTKNAYLGVLHDAGMESGDEIEFAYFGNFAMHHWGQGNVRGQVCFIPLVREGLFPERVPIINVEGACSTASMAFHLAWKDILSGQSHLALAIGVEKLNLPVDRELNFEMLNDGLDRLDFQETIDVYKKAAQTCGRTFNPESNRTLPMDTYAIQACYHMWRYGTTQRQLAITASKSHFYGSMNPNAHYQFECSVEAVLEDRLVSYPFTRAMCCPISDGAATALLCSDDFLKSLPSAVQNRAVKIKASVMSGGKYREFDEPSLTRIAADKAYHHAGLGPEDIDLAEVHDATSFGEIFQAEMMRFCPEGQGGPFIESGATLLDGKIPINISGGLVSKGHPIGATGLSMINELVTQLRGEAGDRQVKNAEFALLENGGGIVGFDEAAASVVILQKDR